MACCVQKLQGFEPVALFSAVYDRPYALFLDSADRKHKNAHYSFIMCDPVETICVKNGAITIRNENEIVSAAGDVFETINQRMALYAGLAETQEGLPPFQGGAAGFFGYDLGRSLETLPATAADNPAMPDMVIGIYDQVFAHDHRSGKSWLITHSASEEEARLKQKNFLRLVEKPHPVSVYKGAALDWEANFDAWDYKDHIRKVIEYIHAGDIFQANLTQRFDAPLPPGFSPFSHYLRLREVNPAPFAAYMNAGDVVISSASPERFLTVQGDMVETRPIKGTRSRSGNPVMDEFYKQDLMNSRKDRAENTMIVDLLRNDLSRVCTPESVEVAGLCELESFARVHHLVSTVRGQLQRGKGATDLLRACFPGGSITGAPKIRAMEIIEELEPTRRGPYCGSMGYIGFDGAMDTSILIRTLVYQGGNVSFQAGGGIVADSRPDAEYEETFLKAEAIFNSFEGSVNTECFEDDEREFCQAG